MTGFSRNNSYASNTSTHTNAHCLYFCSPRYLLTDLKHGRGILEIFGQATGLRVNGNKCLISPVHCDLEDTATLLHFFPGKLAPFPVNYLGIPLAPNKLKKSDLQPLVDKVANCLPAWKASLLNKAGRTVLIKAKLSAIPIHTSLAIAISPWVVKCIDKIRRSFLWNGSASAKGGCCTLSWPKVCRPPELGGLGIINLEIFGYALRIRWLWLQKTDNSRPWSQLPVAHEPIVVAMFNASTSMQLGDGTTTLFWEDRWLQGLSISELAPCLYNAIGACTRRSRTVADGCSHRSWVQDITGALTIQVLLDYLRVWDLVETTELHTDTQDKLLWKWTPDQNFSTASAYRAFFLGQSSIAGAKVLWKARAPGKCKFFGWLALHDRCWTAERRMRHNLQQDDHCALCSQEPETISHLLVGCSFSRQVWYRVLLRGRWHSVSPQHPATNFTDWWLTSRKNFDKVERKSFDSLVILIFWIIWKERNRRTFDHTSRSVIEVVNLIFEEALSWLQAGFRSLEPFLLCCGLFPTQLVGRLTIAL